MYSRQRRVDRATAARAWTVATNSNYTASQIDRVYGRRATVVRMGVADAFLTAAPAGPGMTNRFLLSVGALIPTKGHDLALRAAASSRSRLPVRVVAPRPAPSEEQRLHGLARQLGIELSVEVGVSDGELADRYTAAFATLYLAEREPLGLVSLEAQACGCPVIVAAEGGLPETVVDGVTGWPVPRDPAAAAAAIDRLEESGVRQRASEAATAHGRDWTWSASAAEIQALLDAASSAGASR
jgi:glycosyltransferase involved in cell wall biosynthesis